MDENDGITVIPEMAIENLTEKQQKNIRPFRNSTPVREISLVTRKEYIRERLVNIIKDEVRNAVPKPLLDDALKKYVIPI